MEAFRPRHHDLANPFDLAAFKAELLGEVILPGQSDYDRARRIHDLAYDRHPTMIVRAAGQGDVARTVAFAAESGMQLAVRAGGHSVAGYSTVDGGIVLDLSRMKGLHIDVERRIAWAQPASLALHGWT